MAKPENRNAYFSEHQRANYDRVSVLVRKGEREKIIRAAANKGISITEFIVEALNQQYGLDVKTGKE